MNYVPQTPRDPAARASAPLADATTIAAPGDVQEPGNLNAGLRGDSAHPLTATAARAGSKSETTE